MGRGIIESGLFRTEQLELEQRTSDPANPEPNERWMRVDIKPTYEDANGITQTGVAQYRVANADGSVDTAPVAAVGDPVGQNVIDKDRVHVTAGGSPTGIGFIPHATTGASYPNRKLEHPTAGQVAMHDALTASAIPDSVVYDFESGNLDPFTFVTGSSSDFGVTQSNVIQANNALEHTHTSGDAELIASEPGDGLNYYPSGGETVAHLLRNAGGDSRPGLAWNVDIANETWYGTWFFTSGIRIYRYDAPDNETQLAGTSVSGSADTWYWAEADLPDSDGNMAYRLYEVDTSAITNGDFDQARGSLLGEVTATDTTYLSSDGIGVQTENSGGGAILDWIVTV